MKKIGLFAHNLFTGGITSYLVSFSRYLISKGHDVTLYYVSASDECLTLFEEVIHLNRLESYSRIKVLMKVLFSRHIFKFVKAFITKDMLQMTQIYSFYNISCYENLIEEYDIAISSEEFFCNEFVAYKVNARRKIGWIHPDYSKLSPIMEIDKEVFKELNQIVVVSEENEKKIKEFHSEIKEKFLCIENILDDKKIIELSKEPVNDFSQGNELKILTVCRLDNSSKRIDRIVRCCDYLKRKKFEYKWYIVGEGKDRQSIEKWIEEYGVSDSLILLGNKSNPYPYYALADIFILTSGYEGKPISVEEAKILQRPIIVTRYASSEEQIPSNLGFIIDNKDECISEKIYDILLENADTGFSKLDKDYVFDCQPIFKKIDRLIGDIE